MISLDNTRIFNSFVKKLAGFYVEFLPYKKDKFKPNNVEFITNLLDQRLTQ